MFPVTYKNSGGGSQIMRKKTTRTTASLVVLGLILLVSLTSPAKDEPQREEFQAQAMGQGTQMGQTFNVTILINEYSTPEERQVLVEAFEKSGGEGLFNALNKMKSKGRIAITGTLGYDVSYVRQFPTADGRKIRILTNRPIRFGELWTDSRSTDYNLSALELDISNIKGKSTGTLIPACQFKVNKEKEIEIEAYQNPWKFVDVLDRSKK
jgi:hypothetical protein